MKGFFIGAVIAALFVIVAYSSYTVGVKNVSSPSSIPTPSVSSPALIGGDKDEHGCLGPAGYSWCASKNKCLRVWEEGCPEPEDSQLITDALIKKNNWKPNSVTVTLQANSGIYANGSVPGGYVYAAKVNGVWEIVADGNGEILCSSLEKYPDLPSSMIPGCYDPKTQKNISR